MLIYDNRRSERRETFRITVVNSISVITGSERQQCMLYAPVYNILKVTVLCGSKPNFGFFMTQEGVNIVSRGFGSHFCIKPLFMVDHWRRDQWRFMSPWRITLQRTKTETVRKYKNIFFKFIPP